MNPVQPRRLRLAVLISGGGRTLVNLQRRIEEGSLAATIGRVISSRGDVAGVQRSRELGLATEVIERKSFSVAEFDERVGRAVAGMDLVCMAGFLSLWRMPDEWIGRVINIHPALLPDFGGPGMYGSRVHEAVLAAGRKESGCSVHFCDREYDRGPVFVQRRVAVLPGDTPHSLSERVFEQECVAYPEAIQLLAEGRVQLEGRRVLIDGRESRFDRGDSR